jgi:Uma2 family endonuclease
MTIGIKMNARQFLMLGEDPPGTRLELVHGDIVVSPSPSFEHSYTDRQLSHILLGHIEEHDLGELVGDVDTIFDLFDVRRPDIIFISRERTKLRDRSQHGIRFAPDLCVEIISPGFEEYDLGDKFELYAEHGVAHYWTVDPIARTFTANKLGKKGFVKSAYGEDDDIVKAEPFPKLKIPLKKIWPPK